MDKSKIVRRYKDFLIYQASKSVVEHYISEIIEALDLIPQVDAHSSEYVLADGHEDRLFHAKWDHSLIALTGSGDFAGIIIGYEREHEDNDQYPSNSLYISELSVSKKFQKRGLGKRLLATWLEYNKKIGFLVLSGEMRFAIQTNKASWNKHVQSLYESFGFRKIAEKMYGNRVDNVYSLDM